MPTQSKVDAFVNIAGRVNALHPDGTALTADDVSAIYSAIRTRGAPRREFASDTKKALAFFYLEEYGQMINSLPDTVPANDK